jgi:hypothetical protein
VILPPVLATVTGAMVKSSPASAVSGAVSVISPDAVKSATTMIGDANEKFSAVSTRAQVRPAMRAVNFIISLLLPSRFRRIGY